MIEAAVAQKLRPLQREIVELREEIRLHDILGGIGYIIGIAGISFYFLGVRRRERNGDGGVKA
jgi:nickel transport protein